MARNSFDPFLLLLGLDDDDEEEEGNYSGQTTTDPYPCSFADWQSLFAADIIEDGTIDFADYQAWFQALYTGNETEGQAQWARFNEGSLFPDAPVPEP